MNSQLSLNATTSTTVDTTALTVSDNTTTSVDIYEEIKESATATQNLTDELHKKSVDMIKSTRSELLDFSEKLAGDTYALSKEYTDQCISNLYNNMYKNLNWFQRLLWKILGLKIDINALMHSNNG